MFLHRKWLTCLLLALAALVSMPATAGMLLYVYRLPDGTHLVSNYRLNNPQYKLVRVGENFNGMGPLAAARKTSLPRTTAYDDLIRRVAHEHGMDFSLVKAIVHVESAFNPRARSHKNAHGLMQLLPETAQRYGVSQTDLYDPYHNIQAGVRYLKFLTTQFSDMRHVIAAYNAGEKAVAAYGGIPPYAETKNYVVKVEQHQRRYAKVY